MAFIGLLLPFFLHTQEEGRGTFEVVLSWDGYFALSPSLFSSITLSSCQTCVRRSTCIKWLVSHSRIAQTTAALARRKTIWNDRHISLSSRIRLMRSLVISVLLYASETWTLTTDILRKLQTTEMRCFRKLLGISYRDHITNDAVRDRIRQAIGPYDDILTTVKKRKLKWFGHVSRSSGLAKTILQGTVQGGRKMGRQKKHWENNISEWTGFKFSTP